MSYTIDAVTDGIDAQARVLVTVENRDTETIFNAAGLDFDVLKASAIAYINALSLIHIWIVFTDQGMTEHHFIENDGFIAED